MATEADEPSYRAKQIMDAVYRQRVETSGGDFHVAAGVSGASWRGAGLRLEQRGLRTSLCRVDGTVRYLIGFADGQRVETVWMPEGDGGEAGDGSEAGRKRRVSERYLGG